MGIDVIEKKVFFSSAHENLVNTCVKRNPTTRKVGQLVVTSVFKRVKDKSREGDGNPLIYALKGKDGFTISLEEILKFSPGFATIVQAAMAGKKYDAIVPMPSSHKISEMLARRVARCLPGRPPLITDILEKKSAGEVLEELQGLDPPEKLKAHFGSLKQALEKVGGKTFSMKDVNFRLREHISPLKLAPHTDTWASSILIVDDLLASGSTLNSAARLLKQGAADRSIEAMCLLSGL